MTYMAEYKEHYIVKTEMTKNRTCQSFKWKQLAMSDNLEALKEYIKDKRDTRIINRDTLEVFN